MVMLKLTDEGARVLQRAAEYDAAELAKLAREHGDPEIADDAETLQAIARWLELELAKRTTRR